MRYTVQGTYNPLRPEFSVYDAEHFEVSPGLKIRLVVATFVDIEYDGSAERRAEELAAELNAGIARG